MPIKRIENMGLYYGYPSSINNAGGDVTKATNEFAKFDVVILGDGLEQASHEDHLKTQQIMQNLKALSKKVFGYIPLGVVNSADSLTMAQLKTRVDQWFAMSAYGIFLDEYGFDYGVTRSRQNEIMDYIHGKNMFAIMNAWIPADACGDLSETGSYNPPHITPSDYYFMEDWIADRNSIQPLSQWKTKVEQSMTYNQAKGVGVIAFCTVSDPYSLGVNDSRFKMTSTAAAMYGVTAFQFTESGHSASSSKIGFFPALTNFGTTYTDNATLSNGNTTLTRHTDTGTLIVIQNGTIYDGNYTPYEQPPITPTLSTPTISAVSSSYNQVSITLVTASVSNVGASISYEVYIGGILKATGISWPQGGSRTFNGISAGTPEIHIIAKDTTNNLSKMSNSISNVTVLNPPVAPTLSEPVITAISPAYNQVAVTLISSSVSNVGAQISYDVYIGGSLKSTEVAWSQGVVKTYTGINAGTPEIHIIAQDTTNNLSKMSNSISNVTVLNPPVAPTLSEPVITATSPAYNQVAVILISSAVSNVGAQISYDVYIGGSLKSTEATWPQGTEKIYQGINAGSRQVYIVARDLANSLAKHSNIINVVVADPPYSTNNVKVENMALYYGYPSLVNGSAGNVTKATNEFAKFDLIILGDGLEHSNHSDHAKTQQIMQNLRAKGKKVFGYVTVGTISSAVIKTYIDEWRAMGAFGIFLAEYGFDFRVTRVKQNEILDYIHAQNMCAIMSSTEPADACGDSDETGSYNTPHISSKDYYFIEDWIAAKNNIQPMTEWTSKIDQVLSLTKPKGVGVIALSTVSDPYTLGINDSRFKMTSSAAIMYGISAFQFTESGYSASNSKLGFFPVPTNYAVKYTANVTSPDGKKLLRDYTGTIVVVQDGTTYDGYFTTE